MEHGNNPSIPMPVSAWLKKYTAWVGPKYLSIMHLSIEK